MRKIIHVDMDAFYASIEQRDNPEWRGVPIVVGGSPEGRGGVVATASYEARKFGIRSAMTSRKAKQLCPHVVFVRPRFEVYKEVSVQIRAIFYQYTDLIEPLSLDEAYLDVTSDKQGIGSALEIASLIRKAIREELHLTASAGVSINKFIAKIASDMNKPDGLTFIGPSKVEAFMDNLPVEKFFGVGRVTAEKMKKLGFHCGADLKQLTEAQLVRHFGKVGGFFYRIVRGVDEREVQPHREMKSLSAEDTFPFDLTSLEEMNVELEKIALTVYRRLERHGHQGKTLTVKIKYHDFRQVSRSISFVEPILELKLISQTAQQLLALAIRPGEQVRLLGIGISNFTKTTSPIVSAITDDQLKLF